MNEELELNEGFMPLDEQAAQEGAADAHDGFTHELAEPARQGYALTEQQAQMLPALIEQMLGPVVETMAKMIKQNTEALEQVARTQQVQADRMEALEKQIRLNTPVSRQQVKYMNDAIRDHAREVLSRKGVEDAKSIRKLGGAIRKAVLMRYGVGALGDIPKHEYTVAMSQIAMWNDALALRDCLREARGAQGEA